MTKKKTAPRKKAARLPFASVSGASPKFPLSDEAFQTFEHHLGRALSKVARSGLQSLCDGYLDARAFEMKWQTFAEAAALLSAYEKVARALWEFAYDRRSADDATFHLESMFARHMDPIDVSLAEGDLLHLDKDGWSSFSERYSVPETRHGLRFSRRFMQSLAMNLTVATRQTAEEIKGEQNNDTCRELDSTQGFFLALRKWAKNHDMKYGPYIEGRPSPFAHFVGSVVEQVPERWWYSGRDSSPGAVAMQIKTAMRIEKSTKQKKGGE